MDKLKAIIVDDESHCRVTLQKLIDWHCPSVEIINGCGSADEAKKSIISHKPDLVFLDIAMPIKNGFDLLNELDNIDFDVIFTTAFDEFAIEAFKVHAAAYLLKPIDKNELIDAIHNLSKKRQESNLSEAQITAIFKVLSEQNSDFQRIAIPTSEGIEFVDPKHIIRCVAEGNYTRIQVKDNKDIFISKTLKQVEKLINNPSFIRPHNSHLVNMLFVKKYVKGVGGQLIMDDDTAIPVSRYRKESLKLK